jgi:hypothetical protein
MPPSLMLTMYIFQGSCHLLSCLLCTLYSAVLKINLGKNQCCGSASLWCGFLVGSGSAISLYADPDPRLFTLMRFRIRLLPLMRILIRFFTLYAVRMRPFTFHTDPTFHFDADPRIQILLVTKEMRICDHWHTDPPRLNFEHLRLLCLCPGPPWINFEPLQSTAAECWLWCGSGSAFWLRCWSGSAFIGADPDTAANYDADLHPDPASQRMWSGSMRIRIRSTVKNREAQRAGVGGGGVGGWGGK